MASTFCEQQLGADVFILLNPSSSSCLHPPGTFTILDSSSSWRQGEFPGDQPTERGRDGRGREDRGAGDTGVPSPHAHPPISPCNAGGQKTPCGEALCSTWCLVPLLAPLIYIDHQYDNYIHLQI